MVKSGTDRGKIYLFIPPHTRRARLFGAVGTNISEWLILLNILGESFKSKLWKGCVTYSLNIIAGISISILATAITGIIVGTTTGGTEMDDRDKPIVLGQLPNDSSLSIGNWVLYSGMLMYLRHRNSKLFFHPAKFDNFKHEKISDFKTVSVSQSKNLLDWKLVV